MGAKKQWLEKPTRAVPALNWRYVAEDGLPPIGEPVLVYRPSGKGIDSVSSDRVACDHYPYFENTQSPVPVVAWVPLSEIMETLL